MHRYDDPKFRFGYDKIMEMTETCRQWGKWGPDDEWGTINYIGDEERKEAEEQHIKEMEDRMLWYENELNLNPFSWGKKKK